MAAASGETKGLTLASLRRVRRLWKREAPRLSFADLRALGGAESGKSKSQLEAARQTHQQLKVRIAHRLRDFLFLPFEAMTNPNMRWMYERYVTAYRVHEDFGELRSVEKAAEYWAALAQIFEEHKGITRQCGISRQQLIRMDPSLAPRLDAFFNRFFVSRIGTHLLGANFLNRGPLPKGAKKPAGVAMGVLQPIPPAAFVRNLAESIASVRAKEDYVPIFVDGMETRPMLYVPTHLRVILREVLQNAMSATALEAKARGTTPEPVRVKITAGQFGAFVTVSDRGGGIPAEARIWNWGQDPFVLEAEAAAGLSTADPSTDRDLSDDEFEDGKENQRPVHLPIGFGLPLARLTARYFGGDLRLQTLVGYGTNAYIHIPELQEGAIGGADASMGSSIGSFV